LRIDEDRDYVLQSVPCTFLGADNYCSIYQVRPKACREFPHTDRIKQHQLLKLTEKNIEVCPAVFEIVEKLKKEF
jgi:Fe-S-cluster containining protein